MFNVFASEMHLIINGILVLCHIVYYAVVHKIINSLQLLASSIQ